jgi:hypothetical protein
MAPSPLRQLSMEPVPERAVWATVDSGAASAADAANSTATLFSFFIDSPLEEIAVACVTSNSEPIGSEETGQTPGCRALTTDQIIVP